MRITRTTPDEIKTAQCAYKAQIACLIAGDNCDSPAYSIAKAAYYRALERIMLHLPNTVHEIDKFWHNFNSLGE